MKTLNIFKMVSIVAMVLLFTNAFAQNNTEKNVPEIVVSALKQKYPEAVVKSWKVQDNRFTAKISLAGKNCFADFDENGNWLDTKAKIGWKWNLPATVRTAYNRSPYSGWNIFASKKVDDPQGEFYELMVDNSELVSTFPQQYELPTYKLLKFKADGMLANVQQVDQYPTSEF